MLRMALALLLGVFLASPAIPSDAGRNVFVSDSLEAPLRSGPSLQHRIVAMLKSGRPLELLEEQDGWSFVRALGREGGITEGWILSRYIMTRKPWEVRVKEVEMENAQLKEQTGPMSDALNSARAREAQLEMQLRRLEDSFTALKRNYETLSNESGNYLALKEAHRLSQSSLENCRGELEKASMHIRRLEALDRNSLFLSGAAVLFCGLLSGLVLGRMQRKRKSSLID